MKPFIPLPPRTIEIGRVDLAATVLSIAAVIAFLGIFMGLAG